MNKPMIAEAIARAAGISVNRATKVLAALFSTRRGMILAELAAGRPFRIAGFGTFSVRKRKARAGRNPKSGEQIKIPARRYVVFHVGQGAKSRISGPSK